MKYFFALVIALTIIFYPTTEKITHISYAFDGGSKDEIDIPLTQTETPQNEKIETVTHTSTQNDVKRLIWAYFGNDAPTMIAIGMAESHLNCLTVGDSTLTPSSYGVFQIRAFEGRPPISDLLDCEKNIAYAKELFDRQGFTPWSAYNNGSYKLFLSL